MTTFSILDVGIAGLTTAVALQRIGIPSTVFEAAPELRPVGAGLGLGANAIHAFEALGLREELIACGRLLSSISIRDSRGRVISRTESTPSSGTDNFAIHRADLQSMLVAQLDPDVIHLGKRAERIAQRDEPVVVHFTDGSEHSAKYLIVADGIGSPIRRSLVTGSEPRYAGYTCWRGVVDASEMSLDEAVEVWGP
jgi:2-polyprenyl-6-methoxyphenol hydroxylase-like FAD-dependent oxidoreductase